MMLRLSGIACLRGPRLLFEGLNLSLDGFVGNTFNSHRLVAYAEQQSLEKADEVMGRLLEATHAQACTHILGFTNRGFLHKSLCA